MLLANLELVSSLRRCKLYVKEVVRVRVSDLHQHREGESAAFVLTIRLGEDHSSVLLHNLLANAQTQTQSVRVLACCALQLSKASEQRVHIICLDAYPCIAAFDHDRLFDVVVADCNIDSAIRAREFECIPDQIDENLLEASPVTLQIGQLHILLVQLLVILGLG